MARKNLLMISLLSFLISLSAWSEQGNWKRIKSCDQESLAVLENKENGFRLKMRGKAVDYFLLQQAILPHEVNADKDFIIPLFKGDGRFRGRIMREGESEITFDLHDHGNITLIVSREDGGKNNPQELAVWNYRQCRWE